MIMRQEYREMMKEFLQDLPETEFSKIGRTKKGLLKDEDTMFRLSSVFQKNVEEYDYDYQEAKVTALYEVTGIELMHAQNDLAINLRILVINGLFHAVEVLGNPPVQLQVEIMDFDSDSGCSDKLKTKIAEDGWNPIEFHLETFVEEDQ